MKKYLAKGVIMKLILKDVFDLEKFDLREIEELFFLLEELVASTLYNFDALTARVI